jgi:hypothetical protein
MFVVHNYSFIPEETNERKGRQPTAAYRNGGRCFSNPILKKGVLRQ